MAESDVAALFSQLHVVEKSAVNLERKQEEYILNISSQSCDVCGDEARIAATSSDMRVRLYSRKNLAYIAAISAHKQPVSGVQFSHRDPNLLYTASVDGTIRCWDMREDMKAACQYYEGYAETSEKLTAFDVSSDDKVLCAGTEEAKHDVHLIFWDCRKGDALGVYSESHQDDITQVKFHPSHSASMLSASTDGLVCVYDINQPTEDDALLTTLNSESSVNMTGWCGLENDQIYCLTHTEGLFIWENDEFETVSEVRDIREKVEGSDLVDYMVDCFQSLGLSNTLLLAGNHSGNLQILSIEANELKPLVNLGTEHTDDVRCMHWDKMSNSLVTGGDDSMLCLWQMGSASTSSKASHSHKLKMQSGSKHKSKKHKQPY